MGDGALSSKKEEADKIVQEGCLGRLIMFFANSCVYTSKKHYNPSYIE